MTLKTCPQCLLDTENGRCWRCETFPDYDGDIDLPNKVTHHPTLAERDAQNEEARQVQLRKMLDLLVHTSQCHVSLCQYPSCRKVKGLFQHGIQCKVRASGGCFLCKKMWYLLQLHARTCKESECHVPHCRNLKEHLRRLQQQSDEDEILESELADGDAKNDGDIDRSRKLANHPSLADGDAKNEEGAQLKEAAQLRVSQVQKTLDGLVHASQCLSPQCLNPHCRKVKGLFQHVSQCKTGASGDCVLCENMWCLL